MIKSILKFAVLAMLAILCAKATSRQQLSFTWNKITIKEPTRSAGFINVVDLNNDKKPEVIMSSLMEKGSPARMSSTKGALRIFSNSGLPLENTWHENLIISTSESLPFVNKPFVFDVNEDNVLDIIVCTGFLNTNGGSLQWLAGPDYSELKPFTNETAKGKTDYFWHECAQTDLDNDGLNDIITTSTNDAWGNYKVRVEWLKNNGNGNYTHYIIDETVGGVFMKLFDMDKDGDMDIVLSNFFTAPKDASLLWLENVTAPSQSNNWKGEWERHNIDKTTGKGYNFEFFDIDADNQLEIVYNNHNNTNNRNIIDEEGNRIPSGVYWFEFPTDVRNTNQWEKYTISEGWIIDAYDFGNPASQGSPGIISVGDVDENGFPDVVIPGDGTEGLWIALQQSKGEFVNEKIDDGQMYGSSVITDLDNDGKLEIVATMHEFPDSFLSAIWNPVPDGHIKIYKPSFRSSWLKNNSTKASLKSSKSMQKTNIKMTVWPNPANQILNVSFQKQTNPKEILITNLEGKKMEFDVFRTGKKNTIEIDVSHLEKGMYIISNPRTGERSKFIVK